MISIFTRTIIIYIVLTIMMRIMGKRRIGELEADELVSTLLISEIAAMPIGDQNIPLLNAIIPIIFVCAVEVALSAIKTKWGGLKKLVEGECVYIIYKGRILQDELERNRLSINEILGEMRVQGVSDISEVEYAVLEANGKLSIVKKSEKENAGHILVIDGRVNDKELKRLGYNRKWLEKNLGGTRISEVFLFSLQDSGDTHLILKDREGEK